MLLFTWLSPVVVHGFLNVEPSCPDINNIHYNIHVPCYDCCLLGWRNCSFIEVDRSFWQSVEIRGSFLYSLRGRQGRGSIMVMRNFRQNLKYTLDVVRYSSWTWLTGGRPLWWFKLFSGWLSADKQNILAYYQHLIEYLGLSDCG